LASARFGFPCGHRLGKPADFQHVFSKPFKSADACLTVLARSGAQRHARLGLAISKKNIRKAVARNRLKRLIRESFRLRQATLGGLDIIVMARRGAEQADAQTLRDSLQKHWQYLEKRCDSRWCGSSSSTAL
jgi:ribonuclease P protein component